MVSQRSLHRK